MNARTQLRLTSLRAIYASRALELNRSYEGTKLIVGMEWYCVDKWLVYYLERKVLREISIDEIVIYIS